MTALYLALLLFGLAALLVGLFEPLLRRWGGTLPLLATALGIVVGPALLGWLEPADWGVPADRLLEHVARIGLALGLMGIAQRLPSGYLGRAWRSLALVLGPGMLAMTAVTTLLAHWLLGLHWLQALLLGAILAPTDPVVASSVVTGDLAQQKLPARLRHFLSAESGANDGLAYPLVLLPLLQLQQHADAAWHEWLLRICLWEVGGGIVLGLALGAGAGWLGRRVCGERADGFIGVTTALALLTLGAARLAQLDGVLSVFVAGIAFDRVLGSGQRPHDEQMQHVLDRLALLPVFALFGLLLPWSHWPSLGWAGLAFAVAVLLLRRAPAWRLLTPLTPALHGAREGWFLGWFGPLGVGSMFYAGLATGKLHEQPVWLAALLAIALSVLVHSLTAAPLTRRFRSDD